MMKFFSVWWTIRRDMEVDDPLLGMECHRGKDQDLARLVDPATPSE